MNKQNIPARPNESKLEELLAKIQPLPSDRFYEKMKKAVWRENGGKQTIVKNLRLKFTFVIILLTALGVLLTTPQGRAWAQEIVHFFIKINSTTIQLSDEQSRSMNEWTKETIRQYDLPLIPVWIPSVSPEMVAISGCETPQKSQSYHCQIALAESKLGFDLKELPEKPIDWEFQSLYFDKNSRYAVTTYKHISSTSYSSLMLIQGLGDFSDFAWYKNNPWEAVPADKVEPVSIGEDKGEYVIGRFGLKTGDTVLTWFQDTREQRLIWSEGTRWYLIDFSPNFDIVGTMDKEQLIHLAESLVTSPLATTEPLNPAHLTSISDAKKISGFDLKAPTLLPMNINFSYARSSGKRIDLIYGDNEELIIQEQEGEPIHYTFPIVKINGEDAYFDTSEGSDAHLFLWWHKDGLNYQMDFNQSFGWHIDKGKMILIAESMQDIDDFRKKSGRNYEQIVLYEQALGIDAKKFAEVPAGWTFTNFWGEPYTQCIGMIYTSTNRQGTLFINQCKSDQHSNISVFPSRSIERVKVRNTKGQYIVGDFVMTDDGKQNWDPTSPRKQLYWHKDGLWMQMSLYGESAVLQNKEDLIALAESLR